MTTFRIISLADILSGKYCQHLEEPARSWGRWRLHPVEAGPVGDD